MSSNIKIDPIVISSETRLAEVLIDSYAGAADRNPVTQFAERIPTDGSEIKIRSREVVVNFKTSKRESDASNFADLDDAKVVTVKPSFKHAGLRIGAATYRDSDGEAQELISQWGSSAGDAAGWHTAGKLLEMIAANEKSVVDDAAMFGAHTLSNGTSYDNRIQADLTAASFDTVAANFASALKKARTIPTKAGVAKRFSRVVCVAPSGIYANLRFITKATQLGNNDNTVSLGYGTELFEFPELGTAFGGSDDVAYLFMVPVSGHGGIIWVDREGLSVPMFGPEDSDALNRRQMFEYIARFRDEVVFGDPTCMLKIQKAALA